MLPYGFVMFSYGYVTFSYGFAMSSLVLPMLLLCFPVACYVSVWFYGFLWFCNIFLWLGMVPYGLSSFLVFLLRPPMVLQCFSTKINRSSSKLTKFTHIYQNSPKFMFKVLTQSPTFTKINKIQIQKRPSNPHGLMDSRDINPLRAPPYKYVWESLL